MTELQALLTFLVNLPFFKGQATDIFKFARRLRTCLDHSDDVGLVEEATRLCLLDDFIVSGLNSRKIQPIPGFSTRAQSVLPKFLYGLTSRVFDDTGTLRDNFDGSAVDALLTGLRLVRRCSIKSQAKVAEATGVAEFINAQKASSSPFCPVTADSISVMWSCLLDNPTRDLTLGFPGNGVTSDMRFPYVPKMSFVDTRTVPLPIRGYMVRAIDKFLPSYYELTSPTPLLQIYPYIPYPERVSRLVTVPKSFKTDRAITITNTSSVIIGATLRETIWAAARRHGLKPCMNVHDQKRSHLILLHYFVLLALFDLKGGSTCFTVEQQLVYLSRVPFARNMFNFSRPFSVKYRDEDEVPVTTLTMGDSSCTALLTTNLAFFVLLSIARKYFGLLPDEVFRPKMWADLLRFLKTSGIFDMFAVVGDDVVIPEEIRHEFETICLSQGVVINTRKSSIGTSIHKETCGAFGVLLPSGVSRIYPYRAKTSSSDLVTSMSAISANYGRTKRSRYVLEILIANSSFSHQLEFLNTEGYHESDIGSPLGVNPQPRRIVPRQPRERCVPDDIGCAFGCRDSKVSARESKRPIVARARITKYRSSLPTKHSAGSYDPVRSDIAPASNAPIRYTIKGDFWSPVELTPSEFALAGK